MLVGMSHFTLPSISRTITQTEPVNWFALERHGAFDGGIHTKLDEGVQISQKSAIFGPPRKISSQIKTLNNF